MRYFFCQLALATMVATAVATASPVLTVSVGGSATVYPITEAAAEDFQMYIDRAVHVMVGVSGTGSGFSRFCRRELDVVNASRQIKPSELVACHQNGVSFIELPIAYDAITVLVNRANHFVQKLSLLELKRIWSSNSQAVVNSWNQVRTSWPSQSMTLYAPAAGSGTASYFSSAVMGISDNLRGDYTASQDMNVLIQGVMRDVGGLGFVSYAYYDQNRSVLRAVPVCNRKGVAVMPTVPHVLSGAYEPLSRPLFLYVSTHSFSEKPGVRSFLRYYLDHAQQLVTESGYVPFGRPFYALLRKKLNHRELGAQSIRHFSAGESIKAFLAGSTR